MGRRSKDVSGQWVAPLADWRVALQAAGRARSTITTRADHVARASRALGGSPWAVTPDALVAWAGGQDWSAETRRSVYASLRGFWAWAAASGRCAVSPAASLPAVAASAPMPRPTPDHAYRSALLAADERERLILRLAGECGLRRAEIAQVHQCDLVQDLAGWSLLVHGKGGRMREVPMMDGLARAVRARLLATGGWLLPGADQGHLSARHVGILASRLLPDGWTLHSLRHRCASVAYAADRDLLSVQQLLGHASVATTQRYVRVPSDAVRRAVAHAAA